MLVSMNFWSPDHCLLQESEPQCIIWTDGRFLEWLGESERDVYNLLCVGFDLNANCVLSNNFKAN